MAERPSTNSDESERAIQPLRRIDLEDVSTLPWWKLILLRAEYRARVCELATRCYRHELHVLEQYPQQLSSSEGMSDTTVMSQYVCVGPEQNIASHHPDAMIRHSTLTAIRRQMLGNMPPAASIAERQSQVRSVDAHLKKKRRDSLLTTEREKQCNVYDILKSRKELPGLFDGVTVDLVGEGGDGGGGAAAARGGGAPMSTSVGAGPSAVLPWEDEDGRKRAPDLYDFPPPPPSPKTKARQEYLQEVPQTVVIENYRHVPSVHVKREVKPDVPPLVESSTIPPPVNDFELAPADAESRLMDAALACVDGTQNLYGLSYHWSLPLPPSGFIRMQPDPRYAMWPVDDVPEHERRRIEQERRKQRAEQRRVKVNERNKRLVHMRKYGFKIRAAQFVDSDDDEDDDDGAAGRPDRLLKAPRRPIFDGPLNINIYQELPPKEHLKSKPVPRGNVIRKRELVGTYRQSLLLIHFKVFCRALHEEVRLREKSNSRFASAEDAQLDSEYLLSGIPDIPSPVLQVQSGPPALGERKHRNTPDVSTIGPARCWVGLCATPPADSTASETHVWRFLHRVSFLARQSLRDIFIKLNLTGEETLAKEAFVDFVLDLLHLFFPTHLAQIHVDIAEEEWIYRGTTENMSFDVFFEKFFTFPFIFYRDISAVTEQDYVEFWSLVRLCLYETEETTPTLLPFACVTRQEGTLVDVMKGTCTTTRNVIQQQESIQVEEEVPEKLIIAPSAFADGEDGEEETDPQILEMISRGEAIAKARNVPSEVYAKAVAESLHTRGGEDAIEPTMGIEGEEDDGDDDTDRNTTTALGESAPRRSPKIEEGNNSMRKGASSRGGASTRRGQRRPRRQSLLTALIGFSPSQVAQLYATNFRHEEDYPLYVKAAELLQEDPVVQAMPAYRRQSTAFARAARLLKNKEVQEQRDVDRRHREMEESARFKKFGGETTMNFNGTFTDEKADIAMAERLAVVASDVLRNETSDRQLVSLSGEQLHEKKETPEDQKQQQQPLARHERLVVRAQARRARLEQMEDDQNRNALLQLSIHYQNRHRRTQARHDKACSKIESIASTWDLHAEDVYEPPALGDDLEDRLVAYLRDVSDEVFEGRLSLRERFLIHEAFRKERYRYIMEKTNRSAMNVSGRESSPIPDGSSQDTEGRLAGLQAAIEEEVIPTIADEYLRDMDPSPANPLEGTRGFLGGTFGGTEGSPATGAPPAPGQASYARGMYPLKPTVGKDRMQYTLHTSRQRREFLSSACGSSSSPANSPMSARRASPRQRRGSSRGASPQGGVSSRRGTRQLSRPHSRRSTGAPRDGRTPSSARHSSRRSSASSVAKSLTPSFSPGGWRPRTQRRTQGPNALRTLGFSSTGGCTLLDYSSIFSEAPSTQSAATTVPVTPKSDDTNTENAVAIALRACMPQPESCRPRPPGPPLTVSEGEEDDSPEARQEEALPSAYVMQPDRRSFVGPHTQRAADPPMEVNVLAQEVSGRLRSAAARKRRVGPCSETMVAVMGGSDAHTGNILDSDLRIRLATQRRRQGMYHSACRDQDRLRQASCKVPVSLPSPRPQRRLGDSTKRSATGRAQPTPTGLANPTRGYRIFDTTKFSSIPAVTYIKSKKQIKD